MRQIYDTDLGLDEYQLHSQKTATYPDIGCNVLYPTLGLCGEAGEVAEKIKKIWRNRTVNNSYNVTKLITTSDREEIEKELGDCLWYIAALSNELGLSLAHIAMTNLQKLRSRQERDVIKGSGDNR